MDAAAELRRNPVSKHPIQPEYGDEQADAGREGRTSLARPNSQARTRTGKYSFFPVQLTMSRVGNFTRLILTLAICVTIHSYVSVQNDFKFFLFLRSCFVFGKGIVYRKSAPKALSFSCLGAQSSCEKNYNTVVTAR